MTLGRCFENHIHLNVSLVVNVERVNMAFPGCQANNVFHILSKLSSLCKTHDELSEGRCRTGALKSLHLHTQTCTHAHTCTLTCKCRHVY